LVQIPSARDGIGTENRERHWSTANFSRMRFVRRVLAASLVVLLAGSGLVAQADITDPTSAVASSNVSVVTTLPNPGMIGARFKGRWMFATSTLGLQVYDVWNPRAPVEVARLALPHFENEDVDLGGDILLISNDAAESTGILYVIDIADPHAPAIKSVFRMGGNPLFAGPGHTASCVLQCRYAWITDNAGIRVVDLRDPANPATIGTYPTPAGGDLVAHDVQIDGDGLIWVVGFGGAAAYRLPADYDGHGVGTLVVQTDPAGQSTYLDTAGINEGDAPNDFVLHNSRRTKASPVLYVTEEDYQRPGCRGAGTFETWRVPTDSNGVATGGTSTHLDSWRTELLEDEAAPAVMCSAHYFDIHGRVVAQAWYQQGVRFLDVTDPSNVRQVGYYIPTDSLTWSAAFPPTDPSGRTVYVLDYVNGLTVLDVRLPSKLSLAPTVRAPILDTWVSSTAATLTEHPIFESACLLPGSVGLTN
jgi:hypothetical protein